MTRQLDCELAAAEGMKVLASVRAYVAESGLPPALIHLVYLRVSLMNGCSYTTGSHSRALLRGGMSVTKLALVPVWREADNHFSDQEKAALGWAEALTSIAESRVRNSDFQAAAAQFGEKTLADLTIAIGFINTYNRVAIGFGRSLRLSKLPDESRARGSSAKASENQQGAQPKTDSGNKKTVRNTAEFAAPGRTPMLSFAKLDRLRQS
jgi:AhpD family alkylhydroperoxidase